MKMKLIGKILSVSLAISLAAPLYSMAQPDTARIMELEKKTIPQKIKNIKTTITGLKTANAILTTLVVGTAITGTAVSLAVIIGGVATIVATGGAATPLVSEGVVFTSTANLAAAAAIANAGGLIIAGSVTLLISEGLGSLGAVIFGGMTAATLLTALVDARNIEAIEKAYPGTLTKEQMTTVTQFKNMIKGPIGKGIAKGVQLKKAKETIAAQAIKENSSLITMFGDEKKAQTFIKKYLDDSRELINNKIAYQAYQDKKKSLQDKRAPYKKLDPKHIKLDLEVGALDVKFMFLKGNISSLEKKLNKMNQQYPKLNAILAQHIQAFITQADAFMLELANPTK